MQATGSQLLIAARNQLRGSAMMDKVLICCAFSALSLLAGDKLLAQTCAPGNVEQRGAISQLTSASILKRSKINGPSMLNRIEFVSGPRSSV